MSNALPKIIAIVGPTGSGKTALSLALAKKFDGEIISADSRQFYKKMDIASGKPRGKWEKYAGGEAYMVEGIPHHLMDIVDPGREITVAEFKQLALEKIMNIAARDKVPFLVGGTGLYIWAVIDNLDMPKVAPNKRLRLSLEERTLPELLLWLKKIDPEAATRIDSKNPRRVIRALEVAILSGEPFYTQRKKHQPVVEALQIGLAWELAELYARIDANIENELKRGLVTETQALLKQRYGWSLPSMSSIGYHYVARYLVQECTLQEASTAIKRATHHYAKRQLTWFKRDSRIQWLPGVDQMKAAELVKRFLQKEEGSSLG